MFEPEIAKRCPACGATVRGGAAFCPQCGNALKRTRRAADSAPTAAEERRQSEGEGVTRRRIIAAETSETPATGERGARESKPIVDDTAVQAPPRQRRVTVLGATANEPLKDALRPRIEKLRQTSTSVLDEAADDPGARFVLVAIALFIFTLALLIVSKLLG